MASESKGMTSETIDGLGREEKEKLQKTELYCTFEKDIQLSMFGYFAALRVWAFLWFQS